MPSSSERRLRQRRYRLHLAEQHFVTVDVQYGTQHAEDCFRNLLSSLEMRHASAHAFIIAG